MNLANSKAVLSTIVLGIGIFVLALAAKADTVSGHIYTTDNKPAANMTFTATPAEGKAIEFKTNDSGVFSIKLEPGRYSVTVSTDAGFQGTIESFPEPVQQDVYLRKVPI